jgi:methionine sulfoxide reductase heme-binding subunit
MNDIAWSWLLIRASGVTAWGLLTAVIVWGLLLRTKLLGSKATPVALLHMHRWLGALALGALAVHLVALLVDPVVHFSVTQILIPFTAPWEPFAVALGTISLWLMLPVSLIGRIRTKLGKKGNVFFKRSHLMAYFAWPFATAHYVFAGTDAMSQWSIAALIAGSAVIAFMLLARAFVPPAARKPRAPRPEGAAPASTQEQVSAQVPVNADATDRLPAGERELEGTRT